MEANTLAFSLIGVSELARIGIQAKQSYKTKSKKGSAESRKEIDSSRRKE
jgi:hypothetical protein